MPLSDSASDDYIRVLLLIENRLLRETLVRLFHKRPDFAALVGSSAARASMVGDNNPQSDVRVLDHLPPRGSWLEISSVDVERTIGHPPTTVLISMEDSEEQFFTAVRSGISAYLLKDASADDVIQAVRAAAHGEAICPPRLCLSLFRFLARIPQESSVQNWTRPKARLTPRQQRLVALVAKGLTNKEIASQLSLSEYTIRNSIHRIMKQVEARSRGEAVQAIRAHGYAISV
jgi:DNA-binding NarL/FixJ family response regulator